VDTKEDLENIAEMMDGNEKPIEQDA